jgi:hypothetical protein
VLKFLRLVLHLSSLIKVIIVKYTFSICLYIKLIVYNIFIIDQIVAYNQDIIGVICNTFIFEEVDLFGTVFTHPHKENGVATC